jgi:hypothetical protein
MKRKRVIVIIISIFLAVIGTDLYMVFKERPPIFAFRTSIYKDGGTKVYTGLGYRVIDYHQLDGRDDVVFIPFYKKWDINE